MAFETTPFAGSVENTVLSFRNLYLHHIYRGEGQNQADIVAKDATTGLGQTAVNNWSIYDGPGPYANLVARAQGLHIYAGNWHNSFTIVFEVERFKGSTLQVMGASIEKEGEWAIVGGTGSFQLARGVVTRNVHEEMENGEILVLRINGYCKMPVPDQYLEKYGPWGGIAGPIHDIKDKPQRLESVTISTNGQVITSFSFTYINYAGQRRNEGPWGLAGGTSETVTLKSPEFLFEFWGTYDNVDGNTVVTSLRLVTSKFVYLFGTQKGTTFHPPLFDGRSIVGFSGRSGQYLEAIGVYRL